jgi:hypothetical protein
MVMLTHTWLPLAWQVDLQRRLLQVYEEREHTRKVS